jgi:penicillin-binding protein 1A
MSSILNPPPPPAKSKTDGEAGKALPTTRRFFSRYTFLAVLAMAALCGGLTGLAFAYQFETSDDFDQVKKLADFTPNVVTRIYADDGKTVIGEFALERRVPLSYDEIPPRMREAIMAIEDSRFEKHWGVDPIGLARAATRNISAGRTVEGGSTLTQQLTKILFLSPEQTFTRKAREALIALQIERQFSKQQIMELYCNQINLGGGAYGIEAGAQYYFGKSVKDCTIEECAVLAAIPKAPSGYSPVLNPKQSLKRRNLVIQNMMEEGFITQAEGEAAKATEIKLKVSSTREINNSGPYAYFVEEVRRELEEKFGTRGTHTGGMQVITTVSADGQIRAQNAVRAGLTAYDRRHGGKWLGNVPNIKAEVKDLSRYRHPEWSLRFFEGMYVHGLVTSVSPRGAEVSFGQYHATVTGKDMGIAGSAPDRALKEGDLAVFRIRKMVPPPDLPAPATDKKPAADTTTDTPKKPKPKKPETDPTGTDETKPTAPKKPKPAAKPSPDQPEASPKKALRGAIRTRNIAGKTPAQTAPAGDPYLLEVELQQVPEIAGALLCLDARTGEVKAMVGGYDFSVSKFNNATQANRQTGSCFKPFIYTAALENGWTPDDTIVDGPLQIGNWTPHNYDNSFGGGMPLRTALAKSRNIPAVKLLQDVGIRRGSEMVKRFGISNPMAPYLPSALGATEVPLIEMVSAYSVFPNQGMRRKPHYIRRILNYNGQTVFDWEKDEEQREFRVISPYIASEMVDMMRGVVEGGTATAIRGVAEGELNKRPTGGKTGTVNDFTDAWFIGFTPTVVCGTWIGYQGEKKSLGNGETGGHAALPFWIDFMKVYMKGKPIEKFGDVPAPDKELKDLQAQRDRTEQREIESNAATLTQDTEAGSAKKAIKGGTDEGTGDDGKPKKRERTLMEESLGKTADDGTQNAKRAGKKSSENTNGDTGKPDRKPKTPGVITDAPPKKPKKPDGN